MSPVLQTVSSKETVLITGASGLVARKVAKDLRVKGHTVRFLSRTPGPGCFSWDAERGYIEPGAFSGVAHVIHLAGAGLGDRRWSTARKKEIYDSRVASSRLLFRHAHTLYPPLKTFISASAVGYYGISPDPDRMFRETDGPGEGFLADVCRDWEGAADAFASLPGTRVVKFRSGIVISGEGGAIPKMALPVRCFAGAPLGTGRQWVPWIHIDDLGRIIENAIEDPAMQGAYNAVAPDQVTNEALTKAIARTLNKPLLLPGIPSSVLRLLLGEMAGLVLRGNRVAPERLAASGFTYTFPGIDEALQDVLS